MMQYFIQISESSASDFYLYDHDRLYNTLIDCKQNNNPTVLFGVSFALLDFAEKYQLDFPNLIVMETGGMKGQRKELTKSELHNKLQQSFGVSRIHSEYGMTELTSQLYSTSDGVFDTNLYLSACIHDITDPLSSITQGKQGIVCLTDLANIDSCSFLMTEDTGYLINENQLVLSGRLDIAEARGCNLLLTEILS